MAALTKVLTGDFAALGDIRAQFAATIEVWQKRVQYRRELAELTFRDVQDIGLDQAEIDREVAKPFWRE